MPTTFDLFAENAAYACMRGLGALEGVSAYRLAVEALAGLAGGDSRVLALGEKCLTAARVGDFREVERLLDSLEQ